MGLFSWFTRRRTQREIEQQKEHRKVEAAREKARQEHRAQTLVLVDEASDHQTDLILIGLLNSNDSAPEQHVAAPHSHVAHGALVVPSFDASVDFPSSQDTSSYDSGSFDSGSCDSGGGDCGGGDSGGGGGCD